ncbi:acetyl-CoA carboxylase carboxyl transferase subunit beta [bacterium]|nr:acetyl-CoA carboxylase carboxyl transferase subunit beta [candidate division CSSED10-310 bacterium]
MWRRCDACKEFIFEADFLLHHGVCPHCGHHYRIPAAIWLKAIFGDAGVEHFDSELRPVDALGFIDSRPYPQRLKAAQEKTSLQDAAVSVRGLLDGLPLHMTLLDFSFLGGSMGSVVGEKVARGAERAMRERTPYMTLLCTGGARMQEGILSLMQMAKTAAVLARLKVLRIPYLVYLSDPSTAGCLASFGMVGDIIMAEPGALIGFAGPRVIEQTIGETLPDDFQRAEFQLDHGMVDLVVDRRELGVMLRRLLRFFNLPSPLKLPQVKDMISSASA